MRIPLSRKENSSILFKINHGRDLLPGSLTIVILLPLFSIFAVYPSFISKVHKGQ